MWTGLGASAAVAAGAVTWAVMSHPATTPDGKSEEAPLTPLTAHALLQAGHVQAQHKDFDGAEATYKRVLEMEPRNKLAWYNVGVVSARDGRPDEALKAYVAALKIDPSFTSALLNQAVLLKTSDPDRAITLLERAVANNPKASTAHFQLGDTLSRKGRDGEARTAYRSAVAADPSLHSQVPKKFRDATRPSTSSDTGADR
ncbi:tetratricopeptide repeat protein [Streptomyces marianii]|uniref:tetratricopeptide repeat protein n=1 Tax=Streptomyces marianii TaxID=1817406 RepID=UPI001486CCE2|nr:tetratricopeptide repeat protein [Streptomyces marianii]